jgi:nucleoside-diphosphate-sugar epimerase
MTAEASTRTVLSTGAEGLVGSIVRSRLRDRYTFRNLTRHQEPFSDVVGDIGDLDVAKQAVVGVDAVLHLAGASAVVSSWDDVLHSNIAGTRNIFEAARNAGVGQVVLASTNHVVGEYEVEFGPSAYATGVRPGLSVDVPPRPDSLYGVSKAFGEALGRYYADRFGTHVICLRIGSVRSDDDPTAPSELAIEPWASFDEATRRRRQAAVWLSQRDCAGLIAAALDAREVPWGVAFGVSDNEGRFWDLEPGERLLGWRPMDGARALPEAAT